MIDQLRLQFLSFIIIAGITAITVQVTAHGRADHKKEWGAKPVPGVEFVPPGAGGDELIDDEVLGELSSAALGTSADGSPPLDKETLEEISPFGVIGD